MESQPKPPSLSSVESRYIIMPDQVNSNHTAFGGIIMSWIDMTGAMAAQRHCRGSVVTASIDGLSFLSPINIGDHVILQAMVNYVGKTSMEVGVRVIKENPKTGACTRATTAYLTFVHIDKDGAPQIVPPLMLSSDEEKRRFLNAQLRVQARKDLLQKLQKPS